MLSARTATAERVGPARPGGVPAGGVPAGGTAGASAAAAILLRCDAGGESYCIEGFRVAAIDRAERLEREPGEDGRIGWLSGYRNVDRIPVHSLASLLGLDVGGDSGGMGPILVIAGDEIWGLQVDRVTRAAAGPAEPPLPLPPAVIASCGGRFSAALRVGDRLALVIAPERLRAAGEGGDGETGGAGEAGGSAAGAGGSAAGAGDGAAGPGPSPARNGSTRQPAPPPTAPPPADRRPGAVALFSADPDGRQGDMLFGLSLAQVEEVLRSVPVTPVPGATGDLLGLIVWRDRAVPVVDLARRFGPGRAAASPAGRVHEAAPSRLMVARAVRRREWIAFPVRADLRVEPLPLPSRAWADGPRISPLAALGVFELAAGTVVVPDVDRILTPDRAGPEGGRAERSAGQERGESDEES